MKKLPSINKFSINSKIKNNKVVFDSLKEDVEDNINSNIENSNISVRDKIKELINKESYIFNIKVNLVFKDHEEICQIAGVVNNHIITMDNKIIKIDDVKDIKVL